MATALSTDNRLRRRMERAVDRLIRAIDALDADPDLEEGFDAEGGVSEDEGAQCDDEGFDSDSEPTLGGGYSISSEGEDEYSLGSATGDGNQEHWSQGENGDREDVNEDGGDVQDEPHDLEDEDGEPSDDDPVFAYRTSQQQVDAERDATAEACACLIAKIERLTSRAAGSER